MTRHIHADLMIALAEDSSLRFAYKCDNRWRACLGVPGFNPDVEYRIKERKLTVGHWYMCRDMDGEDGVYCYDINKRFNSLIRDSIGTTCGIHQTSFKIIGESLGELNFEN